ncbi:protein late bloomer isoform X1 [Drosophila novamexicana]|uniref:protein late bloomer isoform X1 n=1 Tax=Drosophila novamexicana TaxID=47314 RepID=UPI0011E5D0D2|nr:protein late bloomer isoform X1 [Drosophila novamexicana]
MLAVAVKYSFIVILGFIVVITVRITVPHILGYDEQYLFNRMKFLVIRVYISLTSLIVLEMVSIYLSVALLYATTDWIAVLYLPLLIYAMHRTYATCVVQLATLISVKDGRDFLIEHWRKYFESDDQFWIEIQAKLGCCGLEGPRTYLDYLLKVPPICYNDGNVLITRGCDDVVYDSFNGLQFLAKGLSWLAVCLQFLTFVLYFRFVMRKYIHLMNQRGIRMNTEHRLNICGQGSISVKLNYFDGFFYKVQ